MKTLKLTIALIMCCTMAALAQTLSPGPHTWSDGTSTINLQVVPSDPYPYPLTERTAIPTNIKSQYNGIDIYAYYPSFYANLTSSSVEIVFTSTPLGVPPSWGDFKVYFKVYKDGNDDFYLAADDEPTPLRVVPVF